MSSEQLLLLLRETNIASLVTGAVQAKLSQGNLRKIQFVRAPDRVDDGFGGLIGPMFAVVRSWVEESRALSDVRDALLAELITGRVRVPLEGVA